MDTIEKQKFRRDFSERLDYLIKTSPYSRRDLAEELGISYPAIASYLNGTALPPLQTACKIAILLATTMDDLCCRDPKTMPNLEQVTPAQIPTAKPATEPSSENPQTYVQQQLRALYTAAEALGFDIIMNSNDGAVSLHSKNKFTNLFFAEMERGADLDATLGIFQDLQIHNKELLDPISYKLAVRATNQKER